MYILYFLNLENIELIFFWVFLSRKVGRKYQLEEWEWSLKFIIHNEKSSLLPAGVRNFSQASSVHGKSVTYRAAHK